MAKPLVAQRAADLIVRETGRRCTRQNLEKLCRTGALKESPCVLQRNPLRIDGETVVAEYLALVGPQQADAVQPRAKVQPVGEERPQESRKQQRDPDSLPDYTESRARSEFEKANLLALDRKAKEGQLLYREDVRLAYGRAVNMARTKILGMPSRAKQQLPHLSPDEVELMRDLLREALEELAALEGFE